MARPCRNRHPYRTAAPDAYVSDLTEAVLDDCELLIVGACYQGRHLDAWAELAPNAVIVAATDAVNDLGGSEVIAEVVQSAQKSGHLIASWAVGITAGKYRFTARDPLAAGLATAS